MNVFGESSKQLLQALTANAEKETMDYVFQEMQAVLGDEMPEEDAVRTSARTGQAHKTQHSAADRGDG